MTRIITVELKKLIPNNAYVFEHNLQRAREGWNKKDFKDGSWLWVFPLDAGYFIVDGDHRTYITVFEKNIERGKVTLLEKKNWSPDWGTWTGALSYYKRAAEHVFSQGVYSVADLETRIVKTH